MSFTATVMRQCPVCGGDLSERRAHLLAPEERDPVTKYAAPLTPALLDELESLHRRYGEALKAARDEEDEDLKVEKYRYQADLRERWFWACFDAFPRLLAAARHGLGTT